MDKYFAFLVLPPLLPATGPWQPYSESPGARYWGKKKSKKCIKISGGILALASARDFL